jgi:murein DD-endopeptidase MepM/ murein hydrolase activator NlpD
VQLVSPGDRVEESARQEGPPRHILEENARLRRELKHLEALEAARGRVAQALASTGALYSGPLRLGAGGLAWPVTGPVVSPFGQRWGRLHAGVDIAAPAGTVIRAAAAGAVAISGPVGGYGNYVCVQHSARLTTCYAHLSRFLTEKGAVVRQGESIGLVGCTGHCFGDHLHFETWLGGRPVDPMSYL